MAKRDYLESLMRDLESHTEVRRFGSGWLSGFFGLLFAIAGFGMVIALRFPDWFATPELEIIKNWGGFRGLVHAILLVSYGLSLLSLLLRPRKALGLTALMIGLAAILVGGSNVQPQETRYWGIFFGLDFFVVNLLVTGFMFAPLERAFPHRRTQRLFRIEWREDLFYYLVSTMFVQVLGFLALAPSTIINEHTSNWQAFRAGVASLPWIVQFLIVIVASDMAQYWFHRTFHRYPFLWGFHAVHHSAKVDGLACGVADAFRRDHPAPLDHVAAAVHARLRPVGDAGVHRLRLCLVVAAPRQCRRQFQPPWPLDRDAAVPSLAPWAGARSVRREFRDPLPVDR
jgi:hypothetical protein